MLKYILIFLVASLFGITMFDIPRYVADKFSKLSALLSLNWTAMQIRHKLKN